MTLKVNIPTETKITFGELPPTHAFFCDEFKGDALVKLSGPFEDTLAEMYTAFNLSLAENVIVADDVVVTPVVLVVDFG